MKTVIEQISELEQGFSIGKRELEEKHKENKAFIENNTIESKQENQIRESYDNTRNKVNDLKNQTISKMETVTEKAETDIERDIELSDLKQELESGIFEYHEKRENENKVLRDKKIHDSITVNNMLMMIQISSNSVDSILRIVEEQRDNTSLLETVKDITVDIDRDRKIKNAIDKIELNQPKNRVKKSKRIRNVFIAQDNASISHLAPTQYFK